MNFNCVLAVNVVDNGTIEPVTLDEVKTFCSIDFSDTDNFLTALVSSARQLLEKHTNTSFTQKTINALVNNSAGDCLLPYGPVLDLISINDVAVEAPLPTFLDELKEPKNCKVKVEYTSGFTVLPEIYKTALLNQVYFMFVNRGADLAGKSILSPIAQQLMEPLCRIDS